MEKPDPNYLRLLTTEELWKLATQSNMYDRVHAEFSRRRNCQIRTIPISSSGAGSTQGGQPASVPGRRGGRRVRGPKFPRPRRIGSLTILRFSHSDRQGHAYWFALCECQKQAQTPRLTQVRQDHFLSGRTTSCGCRRIALQKGNRRARKQSGRTSPVKTTQVPQNTALTGSAAQPNLVLRSVTPSPPPTCKHGFKLIRIDFDRGDGKARYCEICGLMNDVPAARSPRWRFEQPPNWERRLQYENLAITRGMAPSTDSPTSPNARKFSKTADKVWAGGKNVVQVGSLGELEAVDGVRQTEERTGGRRRSASGLDKIKPWQNPNIDLDRTEDTADSRLVSHYEPGHPDFDQGVDNRTAEKPEDLFDQQTLGCDSDRDERALLKHALDEKVVDEDAAETMADYDEEEPDSKETNNENSSCDD